MASQETKRKRRRDDAGLSEGLGIPSIPGIPISVLPFYIQAMKDVSAYLKTTPNEAVRFYRDRDAGTTEPIQRSISMVTEERSTQEEDARKALELKQKAESSVSQWLQTIRTCLRENFRQDGDVVARTMDHLNSLSKRAVTHLIGRLLWKSADARKLWVGQLLVWTDSLTARKPVWQREAYWLLVEFNEKYGDMYPTVFAGVRRMEQICPCVLESSSDLASTGHEVSTLDLRRVRDQAMDEIDRVEATLRKRIDRAYKCLDIIAPHLVQSNGNGSSKEETKLSAAASMCSDSTSEDESDDIQWEEGDNSDVHAQAVERTLAAMRVTGGLTEGSIEIDFEATAVRNDNQDSQQETRARERLEKVMTLIVGKGIPLVSRWIQALTQADSLTRSEKSEKALVQMTKAQSSHRKETLERLMELKQRLACIVSSAQRLGVEIAQQHIEKPPSKEKALQMGKPSKRSVLLREKLSRRNMLRKQPRSNKIQIKYRTDL